MNTSSLFFDSHGDDIREYNQSDLALPFKTFVSNGVWANIDPAALSVTADGGVLTLRAGVAMISGHFFFLHEDAQITAPAGNTSVFVRLNLTQDVRDIYVQIEADAGDFPEPVRTGNIYDLCVAHVADGVVTDTRPDRALCGFSSFVGQPPYQPPKEIPWLLWAGSVFPNALTPEQWDMITDTPSFWEMYQSSLAGRGLEVYDTPGVYIFTAPRTGYYNVEVVGGGGLYASTSWPPFQIGGGGGGYAKKLLFLTAGEAVTVTVGAAALNGLNPNYSPTWDAAGAASSFGAYVTAPGGSGRTGGVPTTGDLNIPGSNGGVDPEYTQGISFYAVSGRLSSGYGVGSGGLTTAQGAPNGSTGGLVMISW